MLSKEGTLILCHEATHHRYAVLRTENTEIQPNKHFYTKQNNDASV